MPGDPLSQESANGGPQTDLLPLFINNVLLEHSHAHPLKYWLRLLLSYNGVKVVAKTL